MGDINNYNSVERLQEKEEGLFLSYSKIDVMEVCSPLMQFDMVDDETYEYAFVAFRSPFIRERLKAGASWESVAGYYKEFLRSVGMSQSR